MKKLIAASAFVLAMPFAGLFWGDPGPRNRASEKLGPRATPAGAALRPQRHPTVLR